MERQTYVLYKCAPMVNCGAILEFFMWLEYRGMAVIKGQSPTLACFLVSVAKIAMYFKNYVEVIFFSKHHDKYSNLISSEETAS